MSAVQEKVRKVFKIFFKKVIFQKMVDVIYSLFKIDGSQHNKSTNNHAKFKAKNIREKKELRMVSIFQSSHRCPFSRATT
jgi:hypothetical protein